MQQFKLNHICHRAGCEGGPGDVVTISDADIEYLLAQKGGAIVADDAATTPIGPVSANDGNADDTASGKRRRK
jgi:hypothetical protein